MLLFRVLFTLYRIQSTAHLAPQENRGTGANNLNKTKQLLWYDTMYCIGRSILLSLFYTLENTRAFIKASWPMFSFFNKLFYTLLQLFFPLIIIIYPSSYPLYSTKFMIEEFYSLMDRFSSNLDYSWYIIFLDMTYINLKNQFIIFQNNNLKRHLIDN